MPHDCTCTLADASRVASASAAIALCISRGRRTSLLEMEMIERGGNKSRTNRSKIRRQSPEGNPLLSNLKIHSELHPHYKQHTNVFIGTANATSLHFSPNLSLHAIK